MKGFERTLWLALCACLITVTWMYDDERKALRTGLAIANESLAHPGYRMMLRSNPDWRLFFGLDHECTMGPTRPDGDIRGECEPSTTLHPRLQKKQERATPKRNKPITT